MKYLDKEIGQIVKENFATAKIFRSYGLDFCCHGNESLKKACEHKGVNPDIVCKSLDSLVIENVKTIPFESWPLDLILDYILKIHHRNIYKQGPELIDLLNKVAQAHGDNHPYLYELQEVFTSSINDLFDHLQKEEQVLFPYLYDLYSASQEGREMEIMHCGSITNPIRVMRFEHENEGNRYMYITELTNNFEIPADACASYRLLMEELKLFMENLFEHIHLENNVVFPEFIVLEEKYVRM